MQSISFVRIAFLLLGTTCAKECDGESSVFVNNECIYNDKYPILSHHSYKGRLNLSIISKIGQGFQLNWTVINQEVIFHLRSQSDHIKCKYLVGKARNLVTWMIMINPEGYLCLIIIFHRQLIQLKDSYGTINRLMTDKYQFIGSNTLLLLGYEEEQLTGTMIVKFKQSKTHIENNEGPNSIKLEFVELNEEEYGNIFRQDDEGQDTLDEDSIFKDTTGIDWWGVHMYTNIICWGILIDIPMVIIRYWKPKRWYQLFHGFLMIIIVLSSLTAGCLMIYNEQPHHPYNTQQFKINSLKQQLHLIFGTSILISIVCQSIAGWMLQTRIADPLIIFNDVFNLRSLHRIMGYSIYYLAKINIVIGVLLSWPGQNWQEKLIYAILLFTIFWRLVLEIGFQLKSKWFLKLIGFRNLPKESLSYRATNIERISMTNEEKLISYIELLAQNQDYESIELEYPNKKWVLFNNSVIDLTNQIHPGGQYLWDKLQGREISRYIYGAYAFEQSTMKPYRHSEIAIKMIEKLTIGTIRCIDLFNESNIPIQNTLWTLQHIEVLSPNIHLFGLKKEGVTFRKTLQGIENFGRYFILSSEKHPKIHHRNYTMILCMTQSNQQIRKEIINYCFHKLGLTTLNESELSQSSNRAEISDEFPIIIKKITSQPDEFGFSKYIHQLKIGDQISMRGPYGTSLGINHHLSGTIILVAGGTGILAFLDLLDFLLQKTMYFLMTEQQQVNFEELYPSEVDYGKYFQQSYKFILLLSVEKREDLIGTDIYLPLIKLQQFLKLPNFELFLSIKENSKVEGIKCFGNMKFDQYFLRQQINEIYEVQRFIICGSPKMNRQLPMAISSLGINKNKIHIV